MPRSRVVSVRLGPWQEEMLRMEAHREGVTLSQFMRDAAFARAIWQLAKRSDEQAGMWFRIASLLEQAEGSADDIEAVLATALRSNSHQR